MIVPARDRASLLRRCLASLARERGAPSFEVVVVDDGSRSPLVEQLARDPWPFELRVERQINLGVAAARNLGLAAARGEDVLFLDSDCVLESGALTALAACIDGHPADVAFQLHLRGGDATLADLLEDLRLAAIQDATRTADGHVLYANTSGLALRGTLARRRAELFDLGAVRGEDTLLLAELLAEGRPPRLVEGARVQHLPGLGARAYAAKHFAIGYYTGSAREALERGRAGLLTPRARLGMLRNLARRSRGRRSRGAALALLALCYTLERAGRAAYVCAGIRPRRQTVLGLTIDPLRERELVARILGAAERREARVFSYATAWTLVQARRDPRFARALAACDLVYPDGMGVVLSLFLLRLLRCRKLTAGDFFLDLCEGARRRGLRVAFVGTRAELLERCVARVRRDVPGLSLVLAHQGFLADGERAALIEALRRAAPHLVVLGMGQALQERFASELRRELPAAVHCVGGLFDQLAGSPAPPPRLVRRLGLEWIHRLTTQPRRLWRRYVFGLPALAAMIALELLRLGRARPGRIEGAHPERRHGSSSGGISRSG